LIHRASIQEDCTVSVIDTRDIQTMMIRVSPPVYKTPSLNEEADTSIYASHIYVSVDILSSDQISVPLPEDSVRILRQERDL
jgi:hypothetical protein